MIGFFLPLGPCLLLALSLFTAFQLHWSVFVPLVHAKFIAVSRGLFLCKGYPFPILFCLLLNIQVSIQRISPTPPTLKQQPVSHCNSSHPLRLDLFYPLHGNLPYLKLSLWLCPYMFTTTHLPLLAHKFPIEGLTSLFKRRVQNSEVLTHRKSSLSETDWLTCYMFLDVFFNPLSLKLFFCKKNIYNNYISFSPHGTVCEACIRIMWNLSVHKASCYYFYDRITLWFLWTVLLFTYFRVKNLSMNGWVVHSLYARIRETKRAQPAVLHGYARKPVLYWCIGQIIPFLSPSCIDEGRPYIVSHRKPSYSSGDNDESLGKSICFLSFALAMEGRTRMQY